MPTMTTDIDKPTLKATLLRLEARTLDAYRRFLAGATGEGAPEVRALDDGTQAVAARDPDTPNETGPS